MDTTKPRLIGLYSPRMQSGKSTVAEHLQLNHNFKRISFAEPLKQMVRGMLFELTGSGTTADNMVYFHQKEDKIDDLGVTPRWIMQTLGTEWGRDLIHPDLWIKIAMAKVRRLLSQGFSVVIDDMRFPNEYRAVKELGQAWIIMRSVCDKDNSWADLDAHASEGQLDWFEFDNVLFNCSTKEDLFNAVDGDLTQPIAFQQL